MAFDPDIERVNPYSSMNPRVTAPEPGKDRHGKRQRENHPEEPEDVLELHEEAEAVEEAQDGIQVVSAEDEPLDLSA
ncbi:MAG: hypothetical protein KIT74_06045 [Fimbriimonadales bacterium]|nr:hypothetical protein [Fimbriimonadales bacterium]